MTIAQIIEWRQHRQELEPEVAAVIDTLIGMAQKKKTGRGSLPDRLVEFISEYGEGYASKSEINYRFHQNGTADDLHIILRQLCKEGRIRYRHKMSGGRLVQCYTVHGI